MNSIQNEWEIPGFPIPSLQLVLHGALLKVPTVILRGFYHPTQTAITSNHEKINYLTISGRTSYAKETLNFQRSDLASCN